MNAAGRLLVTPLVLAALAFAGCDGAGPTGPLTDLDDQLMGASAMQGKKTTSQLGGTTTTHHGGSIGETAQVTTASTTSTVRTAAPRMVRRTAPLTHDVSTTQRVGAGGGTIALPREAGVSVRIPRGALDHDVDITITALAGELFAIQAGPHGLQFRKPIDILFDKSKVSGGQDLVGIYWEGSPDSPTILEIFELRESKKAYVLRTTHFSGYALASM